jgi:polysaccharide export outer membrane protein
MMKKICISAFLGLFAIAVTSFAFEYQGRTITAQDIQNLPPGTIENLPPGTLDQLKKSNVPSQEKIPEMDSGQKEAIKYKSEDTTNELKGDAAAEANGVESDQKISDVEKKPEMRVLPDGSIIEQQYRHGYSSSLSSQLKQFGYNIFDSAKIMPSSLAVPDVAYIIGTGDQFLIRVWGSGLDAEYSAVVDREGAIQLPKIGVIQLAGVKFGDVESILQKESQKYIQGINIKATLTKLRSLEIFVVGSVENPGLHMIPAFSTIFDGLLAAGGVKKSGTLRQIKLNRANKQIRVFDVYDLLLKGSRNTDEILRNKDVIFVPGIGQTAAIAGAVNNEGIYEIIKKSSITDLVELSGGLLPQAYGFRIYLRRFDNNQSFIINDINSNSTEEWKKIAIQNGDLLELTFSSSQLPDVVKLTGHVWSPDVFQFRPGMKLSEVLTSSVLLRPDAITNFALIYRYDVKTTRTIPMRFPLSKVFSGEYDATLHSFDEIKILSRAAIGIQENFSITGAVWKPGSFEYKEGLKLKDALALAGGVKVEARTDRLEIKRKIKTNNKFETRYIQLDLAQSSDFILQPEDHILIPKLEDYFVSLEGHVWYPEKMKYNSGMKLSDVLISKDLPKPEDLLKPDALMDFGLIERYDATTTRTTSVRFPLANVFKGNYDVELQPFDKIKVLSRQELGIAEKYSIEGAVWKSGDFNYQPGLRLNDALALAGGMKFGARQDKVEIARQIIEDDHVVTQYILVNLETDKGFLLNPYDSIVVPMIRNATFARKVTITGEIAYPGNYTRLWT